MPVVVGNGVLATALYRLNESSPASARTSVYASDSWQDAVSVLEDEQMLGQEVLLPVIAELDRIVVGPVWQVEAAGCPVCHQTRRSLARPLQWLAYSTNKPRAGSLVSPLLSDSAAQLAASYAEELLMNGTTCQAVYVRLNDLAVTRHSFLADPVCSFCANALRSYPQSSRSLEEVPQSKPGVFRNLAVPSEERLREAYVDPECGLITRLSSFEIDGYFSSAAVVVGRHGDEIVSGGRAGEISASRAVAILEGLERYGGLYNLGSSEHLMGSYDELSRQFSLVDPRTLGLPRTDAIGAERSYRHDAVYSWVESVDVLTNEVVLVPEAAAFYRSRWQGAGSGFMVDSSNGCALGSSWSEAVLYGVLEIIERDAFLATWLTRRPVRDITRDVAASSEIAGLLAVAEHGGAYRVQVFETTTELGIPSVWALARLEDPLSGPGPAAVCSAGSGLSLGAAASGAAKELAPLLKDAVRRFPETRVRARALASGSVPVGTLEDHGLLYTDVTMLDQFDFVGDGGPSSLDIDACRFLSPDGAVQVRQLVDELHGCGLRVLAVDQTGPEHVAAGLVCVKIIIPGMVPMTFGHENLRVEHLDRLLNLPELLGYGKRRALDELNRSPHPFS